MNEIKDCKHFKAYILGSCKMSYAWCPECKMEVQLMEVFNNMLDELRKVLNGQDRDIR
jgi:hypothetical protein